MTNSTPNDGKALIAENRKARHEFFIEERLEAGLMLAGWEVKSLRAGRAQLAESYVVVSHGEVFLVGAHITPLLSASTHVITNATRQRKLLMNRSEIDRLVGAVERAGYTLVPLELYWKAGRAKLQGGSGQGQEAARQARHREGPGLATRQGPRPARPLIESGIFTHRLPSATPARAGCVAKTVIQGPLYVRPAAAQSGSGI